jgi:hypothetical protein
MGINIPLRSIGVLEKKGCYSAVFKGVEGKLLCFKFNMEVGLDSIIQGGSYTKQKQELNSSETSCDKI